MDNKILLAAAGGFAAGGLACYLLTKSKGGALTVRSTAASGSTVYESARAVVRRMPV